MDSASCALSSDHINTLWSNMCLFNYATNQLSCVNIKILQGKTCLFNFVTNQTYDDAFISDICVLLYLHGIPDTEALDCSGTPGSCTPRG